MNLDAAIDLVHEGRNIQAAGPKANSRFQPVHAGAHMHFMKIGYMHTGNKNRGGIATSHYFKTKKGNSREIAVQADGSFVKMARTVSGMRRSRGKIDAKGMRCGGPGSGRHKEGGSDQRKDAGGGYKAGDKISPSDLKRGHRFEYGGSKHTVSYTSTNPNRSTLRVYTTKGKQLDMHPTNDKVTLRALK